MTTPQLLTLLGGIAQVLGVVAVVAGIQRNRRDARVISMEAPVPEDFGADWREEPWEQRQSTANVAALKSDLTRHFIDGTKLQIAGVMGVLAGIALTTAAAFV